MSSRRRTKIETSIVHDAGDWARLEDVEELIEAAVAEVAAEPRFALGPVEVTIVLSNEKAVAALNGQFRGKPKPTNVLSFPPGSNGEQGFLGDIVLAEETIAREARDLDISFEHHVQHLVVHGLLHLLGFDHQGDAEAQIMENLEIQILSRLDIANPYTGSLERDTK